MKSKVIILFFSGLLLSIGIGLYFVFSILSKESSIDEDENSIELTEKQKRQTVHENRTKDKGAFSVPSSGNATPYMQGSTPTNGYTVDQSIKQFEETSVTTEEKLAVVGNSEGVEWFDVEFTVIEGQENKLLAEKDFQIQTQFGNSAVQSFSKKSDKVGKLQFKVNQTGLCRLFFQTADYAPQYKAMNILLGKNTQKLMFFKGGTIYVKVNTEDNKNVEELGARMEHIFMGSKNANIVALKRDIGKGVFVYENASVGANEISFVARGFQETKVFKITVAPQTVSELEIYLQSARMILFQIQPELSQDSILISHIKYIQDRASQAATVNPRLPRRGSNSIQSLDTTSSATSLKIVANKTQEGLYELELTEIGIVSVVVEVDGFSPAEVQIVDQQDLYTVSLTKAALGNVVVQDEAGKPLKGALVNYSSELIDQTVSTNEKGIAEVVNLSDRVQLQVNVTLKNYIAVKKIWSFNSKNNKPFVISLKAGHSIIGKVKTEGKAVVGAKITLISNNKNKQNGKPTLLNSTSSADGSFLFGSLSDEFADGFTVTAYHQEFGNGQASISKIDETSPIELNLTKEKSIELKVSDQKGRPLAEQKVLFKNLLEPEYSLSAITDENGKFEAYNLKRGAYLITLNDSKYKSSELSVNIPCGSVELTSKGKNLRKINVGLPKGGVLNGELYVLLERNEWPMDVVHDQDGYFVEIHENEPIVFVTFLFRTQGYADVRKGPYNSLKEVPDVFDVTFQQGENFKVRVTDDESGVAIPYATVGVTSGNTLIESMPTNSRGEIDFIHIGGKFLLNVTEKGYAPFETEWDGSANNFCEVRLQRSGSLSGHMTIKANSQMNYGVLLKPNDKYLTLDKDGNFLIANLVPGEYSLNLVKTDKSNKPQYEKIPARILIESGKTFEINLDDYLKSDTSLTVEIYNGNSISTAISTISLATRSGQTVVSSMISNGQYTTDKVLPGEYLLSCTYSGGVYRKWIEVQPLQSNMVTLNFPGATCLIRVKNADNKPISKVMVTAYVGEKFSIEDAFLGNQQLANANGEVTFSLLPQTSYYFLVEEDFRYNYKIELIGPISLEPNQFSQMDFVLPYARKLPKLLITDQNHKPLSDVAFLFTNEKGQLFHRALLKEWDFYPFSNAQGFLPENCWPTEDFLLTVNKTGYETKTVKIPYDYDNSLGLSIQLNYGSKIICNISQKLANPIAIGILDKNGILLQKPLPYPNRKNNDLMVYYDNISTGAVTFSDLATGEYFIGYFWNGSTKLLSKQGPIIVESGKIVNVDCRLQLEEF